MGSSEQRGLHSLLAVILFFLTSAPTVSANNYPDIHWRTIRTPHFVIHYYDDVEWTARKVAAVAEEIYPKVTAIYRYEPSRRTHIVVRDDEDTSNGFAIFSLGYITIWASPSDLRLRGRHDWIRGVITHEFSHVVSLLASSGGGWLIDGLRFGGVSNANNRSNASAGGTVFFPTSPYSRWWAEGTAQLDASTVGYDLWDTNQDMLLRAATLENNLLTFDQMRNLNVREHYGGEMVYNQGYAFLLWLRDTYGQDVNLKTARTAADTWNLDFDRNLENAVGKSARTLYDEWKAYLLEKYQKQTAEIQKEPIDGERIQLLSAKTLAEGEPEDRLYKDGVSNAHARFSPDGRWFSRVERTTLFLRYLDDPFVLTPPEDQEVEEGDKPAPLSYKLSGRYYSWAPDSRRIVLSERRPNILNGYPYYDLFLADLGPMVDLRTGYLAEFRAAKTQKEREKITRRYLRKLRGIDIEPARITRRQRATHPAWSPDGNWIAFSENRDGHRNLRLIQPDGTGLKDLFAVGGDSEALDATWSPDSKRVAFTFFHHDQSDIWAVDVETGKAEPLTLDPAADQEPAFTPDGKEVIFASDRTGIFQLYRIPAFSSPSPEPAPITRGTTGAFMPNPASSGKEVLFIRYTAFGFKPYRIPLSSAAGAQQKAATGPSEEQVQKQITPEEVQPFPKSSSYFPWPRPARFFPTFIYENDQFKTGVGVQLADFLEQHTLSVSAIFGKDQDYQFAYLNRMFYPDLTASYTSYVRNNSVAFLGDDGDGIADEPQGVLRDNIQFLAAGLSQDFRVRRGLSGTHVLSLTYNRRFVDRRAGFPVLLNDQPATAFRLVTNDGFSLQWDLSRFPSVPGRDFDINPRSATYASLGYSFVHTRLFSADAAISDPNRKYYYHEGTATFSKYFALPWKKPWWCQHTYWLRFAGGFKSRNVTSIDEFFLGGRINYRAFGQISSNTLFYGYEAFSISGETMVLLATGYTFPLVRAIDRKIGLLYFDSVYASIFGEVGNAWDFGEVKNLDQGSLLLEDIGAEIRLKSFFLNENNRWSGVFRIAYGFQDNAANGFAGDDLPVRFYVGIGTDF